MRVGPCPRPALTPVAGVAPSARRGERCRWDEDGIRRFGAALKTYLVSRPGRRLLAETVDMAKGWDRGGCGYLADSLRAYAPKLVQRRMVVFESPWTGTRVSHVVARVNGYYVDAAGVQTEGELLHLWDSRVGSTHKLVPYHYFTAERDVAQCIALGRHDLTKALRERFGDPAKWFCKQ